MFCVYVYVLACFSFAFSRMNMNLLRARTGMQMRAFQMLLFAIVLYVFVIRIGHNQRSVQDRAGVFYQTVSAPLFIGMLTVIALCKYRHKKGRLLEKRARMCLDDVYCSEAGDPLLLSHIRQYTMFSARANSHFFALACKM